MPPVATPFRLSLGAAAVIFMAGCASYHAASYPVHPERPQEHDLAVGARVRITLATGDERYGRVAELTDSGLTMSRHVDGVETVRVIPLDDIAAIEVEGRSRTREVLLISFLAVVVAGGVLLHAFAEGMGGLN